MRPSLIRCKTIIGYGAPTKQGTAATHGAALGADEVALARKELGWTDEAFVIPDDVAKGWREAGARGAKARAEWHRRLDASGKKDEFLARIDGKLGDEWLKPYLDALIADPPKVATRKASEMALEVINTAIPATIGGSADLTGSNNTKTKALQPLDSANYGGRYIYYGIREFGMAAAMNGMALHGGVVPYGGTFLVFSDYCRNAIRLSRAAERARHLRHDPRFDRAWRGRADPPADRASAVAAADPQPRRLSPRRRGRDRRMLGRGAGQRGAERARAVAPESRRRCGPKRRRRI